MGTDNDQQAGSSKHAQSKAIRIIRQYHIFETSDSFTISRRLRLVMFIPASIEEYMYIFPATQKLADIHATDKSGTILPLINKYEFERRRRIKIDDIYKQLASFSGENVVNIKKAIRFCFFILPTHEQDYYDDITISWTEKVAVDEEKFYKITKSFTLTPEFIVNPNIPVFIDIRLDKKYQFSENPHVVSNSDKNTIQSIDSSIDVKTDDKRRFIARLVMKYDVIKIQYKVSVEKMVVNWAKLGLLLGLSVIPIFLLTPITSEGTQFISALAAGILALLFGLRALVFHDTEFMSKWSNWYLIIAFIDIMLVSIIGLLSLNKYL